MSLHDLIVPEATQLGLAAESAEAVIVSLGRRLQELGYVRDDFVEATLAREAEMPTGLPLAGEINAALPHVDLEFVLRPAVALATLPQPVEFHHMVETEKTLSVRLVIMLALDQPKAQVDVLAQISSLLQSPADVRQLVACRQIEQVLALLERLEG